MLRLHEAQPTTGGHCTSGANQWDERLNAPKLSCVKFSSAITRGTATQPRSDPRLGRPCTNTLLIIALELFIPVSVRHFGPVIVFEAWRVLPRGLVYVEHKAIRFGVQAQRLPGNRVQRIAHS